MFPIQLISATQFTFFVIPRHHYNREIQFQNILLHCNFMCETLDIVKDPPRDNRSEPPTSKPEERKRHFSIMVHLNPSVSSTFMSDEEQKNLLKHWPFRFWCNNSGSFGPPDSCDKLASVAYKPLTGQFVCPAHPMQKPHFLAGWMLVSSSTSGLSRPASTKAILGSRSASNRPPPLGISLTAWWGTAGRKKAVAKKPPVAATTSKTESRRFIFLKARESLEVV
mmetsp:Transcript_18642/g.37775  ORF Transcript_18642/g.37775 Transcript_18642/m.37775 type:complete len:224 (+) Transcript_18642:189-860(+)